CAPCEREDQARTRSPRWASSSTARSGMMTWKVAPMVPSARRISPPWARTSSDAIASPSPVPPARADPWNASNRCARAFSGEPRPGVGDLDHHDGALSAARDADLIARRIVGRAGFECLHGVARQVVEHAQKLVVVGVDREAALDRADPADARVRPEVERLAHL